MGNLVWMESGGVLAEVRTLPREMHAPIVSRIKIMANMDIAQTRLPQTGRILLSVNRQSVDIRASTVPVFYGERLVLRLLRRDALLDLDAVCAGDMRKVEHVRSLLQQRRGATNGHALIDMLFEPFDGCDVPGRIQAVATRRPIGQ